jgi:hypothetical protein
MYYYQCEADMKNIQIEVAEKKCERLILLLTVQHEDNTKSSELIDFSGNMGNTPFYCGLKIVNSLERLQQGFESKPGDPDYSEPCPNCGAA